MLFSSPPNDPAVAAGVELPGGLGAKDKVNEGTSSTRPAASATSIARANEGTAATDGLTAATDIDAAAGVPATSHG